MMVIYLIINWWERAQQHVLEQSRKTQTLSWSRKLQTLSLNEDAAAVADGDADAGAVKEDADASANGDAVSSGQPIVAPPFSLLVALASMSHIFI